MSTTAQGTLVAALERVAARPGRGFRFVRADRSERFYGYLDIWHEAQRRAAHLRAMGLAPGDRLALVIPEGDEFVLSFLGAVVAGVVPVPIFPRATFKAIEGYTEVVAHIVEAASARVLLTMEGTRPFVEKVLQADVGLTTLAVTETAFAGETPAFAVPAIDPADLCFLQFTSGSTSKPKGVTVTHANLVANATAFLGPHGLDRRDDDIGVSWLPLYHDMGLIGFILGTIVCDIPVVILPTASFARTPRLWLETIQKHRGTITYAPNFAYGLITKRIRPTDLDGLDLSSLRVAGCGAEPIRGQTLLDFAARFATAGFRGDEAFLPSYGMAESTLAITFHRLGTPIRIDRVDASAMRRGEALPAAPGAEDALELVSCGVPFPGHELAIVGDDGRPLGRERAVGEIVVRGPSVTAGYYGNPEATAAALRDGWLSTGDLGYLADGDLFICGRSKDLIIINGANHHPQDLEWVVGDLEGVRRGNVVAFSVLRDGTEQLIIAAEGNSGEAERLRREIARALGARFGLAPAEVAIVAVGVLPKTSSGKAQRRKTKELFEEGRLPAHP